MEAEAAIKFFLSYKSLVHIYWKVQGCVKSPKASFVFGLFDLNWDFIGVSAASRTALHDSFELSI